MINPVASPQTHFSEAIEDLVTIALDNNVSTQFILDVLAREKASIERIAKQDFEEAVKKTAVRRGRPQKAIAA